MKRSITTIAALLLIALSLSAQTKWEADRGHSQVKFAVTHLLISEVDGRFKDFTVNVESEKEDFSDAKIEAVIKTASITTDNDFRDKDLRGESFFSADSFPEAVYKSTSIEKTGDNTYKIQGTLTLRGVTKPVVLDAKMTGRQEMRGRRIVGFKATTTINRFDYGVKWDRKLDSGGLVVSENVDITLLLELRQAKVEEKKSN